MEEKKSSAKRLKRFYTDIFLNQKRWGQHHTRAKSEKAQPEDHNLNILKFCRGQQGNPGSARSSNPAHFAKSIRSLQNIYEFINFKTISLFST